MGDIGFQAFSSFEEHSRLLDLISDVVPDDGTQVEISGVMQRLALTRFSGGRVHQNVVDSGARFFARAWTSGGAGFSITSATDRSALEQLVERAIANSQHVDGTRIDLPDSTNHEVDPFVADTEDYGPSARAQLAEKIQTVMGDEAVAHGNLRVATQMHALVNSAGLRSSHSATYAAMNLVAQADGRATGYRGAIGRDVGQLDFETKAVQAMEVAMQSRNPVVIPPGTYEVLLDPPAVSMLLVSLGYVGLNAFGASAARSDSAWFKPDRTVGSSVLSLVDDPLDPDALYSPIDAEGTSRRRLSLVEDGVVTGVAHDLTSAASDGTTTTGHALHPGDKGPAPHSLSIPSGDASRNDIIGRMKRGIIINRIHPFVSLRGGRNGELSGTTRDGVFLVENGEIVAPVANVRWSNPMTELLGGVEAVSTERSVEFMDLPEFSPHTNHVPSLYSTHFTVQTTQPRER